MRLQKQFKGSSDNHSGYVESSIPSTAISRSTRLRFVIVSVLSGVTLFVLGATLSSRSVLASSSGLASSPLKAQNVSYTMTTMVTETTVYLPIIQTAGNAPQDEDDKVVLDDEAIFVATDGDDAASGTRTQPLHTIQKAISQAKPGMTVYIRGGVYNQQIRIRNAGEVDKPITVTRYPGEEVIIDGQYELPPMPASGPVDCGETAESGCYNYGALVRVEADYITVRGLDIRHSQGVGILVKGATNVIIEENQIHDIRFAAVRMTEVQEILFQNNDVWGGGDFAPYTRAMGEHMWPVAVFADDASYITYRGNRIHNNWGEGLSTGRTNAHHITIEDNIIYDNLSAQLYIHRANNITAQRNFIYCTNDPAFWRNGKPSPAISVNNEQQFADDTDLVVSDVEVINNVVVGCGWSFAVWTTEPGPQNMRVAHNTFVNAVTNPGQDKETLAIALLRTTYENVFFEKNIILQETGTIAYVVNEGGLTLHSNLWSRQPPDAAGGNGDFVADPQLQNPNAQLVPGQVDINWYKPTASSPAVTNGIGPQEYLK